MQTILTLEQEAVPIVKSSLVLKHKALEFNLDRYQKRLTAFEKKHKMTSEKFKKKFIAGEMGDDQEWFDWEFILDAYQETKRQLDLLDNVRL
ncbi:MAG: hypothetical protein HY879_06075 [Deltaproteobacteria bacterium]|nr:hypothetical protein [Deltaproteobacteria bacterium]